VMLSHLNVLSNAHASLQVVSVDAHDVFLSFLPLSHTFERTCGYYLAMMAGATVAYARSIQQLAEDLQVIRPTALISVPRIYERIWTAIGKRLDEGPAYRKKLFELTLAVGYARFEYQQGRATWRTQFLLWPLLQRLVASKVLARFGGRMRAALSGGAALAPQISRVFLGLGLPLLQGYGLTEASPVVCGNHLDDNVPASVGRAIPGVELKIADNGALLIRGPNVMLGYWNDPAATEAVMRPDGWLDSGDLVRMDEEGRVYITGRVKDILVLSNGEKIAPCDLEVAILRDPLFENVLIVGEGRPYLTLIAVLNAEHWHALAAAARDGDGNPAVLGSKAAERLVLKRIAPSLKAFPGYLQVRRAVLSLEAWTVENGLLTPTLKLKRSSVVEKFNTEIDRMYAELQ
jgi:long-chain acyl-CoA synthetase